MKKFENNINEFLRDNKLEMNISLYNYSPLEPITAGSTVNLLSKKNPYLTIKDQRFELFDRESIGSYFNGLNISESYKKIRQYQTEGLPKPKSNDELDYEATFDLIKKTNSVGISVFGINQISYDGWRVLDENLLNNSLCKTRDTGENQLKSQKNASGKYFMFNLEGLPVMEKLEDDPYQGTEDFYELRRNDGTVLLSNIPFYELNTVLFSLLNGFNVEQAKEDFLWPKISDDDLADADLIFTHVFCSDPLEINSIDDLKDIPMLYIPYGTNRVISKYQYGAYGPLGQSFLPEEAIGIFDSLYHGLSDNLEKAEHELTAVVVSLTDELGFSIFRQQRRFVSMSDLDEFTVNDDGSLKIRTTLRYEDDEPIENVFILLDKNTKSVIKRDMSLDDLINFVWGKVK